MPSSRGHRPSGAQGTFPNTGPSDRAVPQGRSDGSRLPQHRERASSKRIVAAARRRRWSKHRLRSRKQIGQEGSARGFHEPRVGECGSAREVGAQVQAASGASRLFGQMGVVAGPSLLPGLRARGSRRHRRLGSGRLQRTRIRRLRHGGVVVLRDAVEDYYCIRKVKPGSSG